MRNDPRVSVYLDVLLILLSQRVFSPRFTCWPPGMTEMSNMLSQDAKQFAVKAKDLYHQVGGGAWNSWLGVLAGLYLECAECWTSWLSSAQHSLLLSPAFSCWHPSLPQALFRKYLPLIILVAVVLLFIIVRFVF